MNISTPLSLPSATTFSRLELITPITHKDCRFAVDEKLLPSVVICSLFWGYIATFTICLRACVLGWTTLWFNFGTCWAATGLVHFCASAWKPFSIKHTFCKQHQIFGVDDFFTKVINSRGFVLFFSWWFNPGPYHLSAWTFFGRLKYREHWVFANPMPRSSRRKIFFGDFFWKGSGRVARVFLLGELLYKRKGKWKGKQKRQKSKGIN